MLKRIKELREEAGFTQRDMAIKLGVSQTTYSRYEKGNIPVRIVIKLAYLYNVSTDYIMELTSKRVPLDKKSDKKL